MSEQNVTITIQKTKSNAPIILGIIGFVLGIPSVICLTVCAAAVVGASSVNQASLMNQANAGNAQAQQTLTTMSSTNDTATSIGLFLMFFIVCWLVGFILSFMGKSDSSKTIGMILLLCGAAMLGTTIITISFLGGAAATCYMIAGVYAIMNAKLPRQ